MSAVRRSFVLIFLWGWGALSFGALQFPPSLGSPIEYARFLAYLQREMPQLLEQGAEYDVDLLQILQLQDRAVRRMKASAEFSRAAAGRGPLVNVTLQLFGKQTVRVPRVDTKKVLNLVKRGEGLVDSFRWSELEEGASTPDPAGLLTGIIQCHPNSATRKRLFKMPAEEATEALLADPLLTEDAIAHGFRASSHGISSERLQKLELIERVRRARSVRANLAAFLLAEGIRTGGPGENGLPQTFGQESTRVEAFQRIITRLAPTQVSESERVKWREKLSSFWQDQEKGLQVSESVETRVVTDEILLNEVPPYLGAFRGFVGGDCATQYSFLFSYLPNERTFFISDSKGVLRGYVMTTLITVNGRQALYIHDIVGPTVSKRMVDMILQGLHRIRREFGAEVSVLPTKERTFENNNYEFIRTHLQSYVEGRSEVELTYLDGDLRKFIVSSPGIKTVDTYDLPEYNSVGHLLPSDSEGKWDNLTVTSIPKGDEVVTLPELDRRTAILLALDLLQAARSDAAREAVAAAIAITTNPQPLQFNFRESAARSVLELAGISNDAFDRLNEILPNHSALPLDTYYRSIEELLGALDLELAPLLKDKPYFFYEGHLRASDAFSAPHAERSIEDAVYLLKRWPRSEVALAAVAAHSGIFAANPRFKNYLASLLVDQHAEAERLERLLSFGIETRVFRSEIGKIRALAKSRIVSVKRVARGLLESLESLGESKNICASEVGAFEEDATDP